MIEELTEKINRGEVVDFDAILSSHREHAAQLMKVLPTLELFANVGLNGTRQAIRFPSPTTSNTPQSTKSIGDFRLTREIGRGGMGVVYEAEQISLGRRVALKVLPFAGMLDDRRVQRFRNEARAAASLTHPHIVPVHAVGCERGIHYYAMQFIDGPTLAELVVQLRSERKPVSPPSVVSHRVDKPIDSETSIACKLETSHLNTPDQRHRTIATWGVQIAQALEYAHEVGVVHRDIKPANLMLDTTGRVWITDFGLAQMEVDGGLTMTGDIMGTLRYMSPEQAQGTRGQIDHRSDIYSLGLTLYELIALSPAFQQADRKLLIVAILEDDPAPLTRLDRSIPRDFETIIQKMTEKEPARRYQTAGELAEDLKRFLNGRSIQARRATSWDRVAKWCRRNTFLVRVVAIFAFVTSLVVVAALFLIHQAEERTQYMQRTREAEQKWTVAAKKSILEHEYVTRVNLAEHAFRTGRPDEALRQLHECLPLEEQFDFRGFEWNYLLQSVENEPVTLGRHQGEVYSSCVSPDRLRLATGGQDGVRIWDLRSGHQLHHLTGHMSDVNGVSFSRDGRWLASASDDFTVKVWNPSDGSLVQTIPHEGHVVAAVFSPDSRLLATAERTSAGAGSNCVRFWTTDRWEHDPRNLEGHTWLLQSLAFSPDGKLLATASSDQTARVWDEETRTEKFCFQLPEPLSCVAFAHHHPILATVSTGLLVRFWSLVDGSLISAMETKTLGMESVAFSPDDSVMAAAGGPSINIGVRQGDGHYRLQSPLLNSDRTWSVAFIDNTDLVVTTKDGTIGRRRVGNDLVKRITTPNCDFPGFAIHPNGTHLAVAAESLDVYDIRDPQRRIAFLPTDAKTRFAAFSPDGQFLASGSRTAQIFLHEYDQPGQCRTVNLPRGDYTDFRFHGNRQLLVGNHAVPAWGNSIDLLTGELTGGPRGTFTNLVGFQNGMPVSVFARCSDDGSLEIGRANNVLWRINDLGRLAATVVFSRDGKQFAVCREDGRILIWDIDRSTPKMVFVGKSMERSNLNFTPDGKTLVGNYSLGAIKFWNISTGRELLTIETKLRYLHGCAFSQTGSVLVASGISSSGDGEIVIWRLPETWTPNSARSSSRPVK